MFYGLDALHLFRDGGIALEHVYAQNDVFRLPVEKNEKSPSCGMNRRKRPGMVLCSS